MITSADEAKLLLNKLSSSASRVVASFAMGSISGLNGFVCRVSGRITHVDEVGGTFVFVPNSEDPEDVLLVAIFGCSFGFTGPIPLSPAFKNVPTDKWDSTLYISFPNGSSLILFAEE